MFVLSPQSYNNIKYHKIPTLSLILLSQLFLSRELPSTYSVVNTRLVLKLSITSGT